MENLETLELELHIKQMRCDRKKACMGYFLDKYGEEENRKEVQELIHEIMELKKKVY